MTGRRTTTRLVALAGTSAAALAMLVAVPAYAAAPGSPACNATGGNLITSTSAENVAGNFVHTFTASGTFTPKQAMTITYLIVAGGGGGGGAAASTAGGGGGAGEMITASVAVTANTAYTITVGGGGAGGASTTSRGTVGSVSSIGSPISVTAQGGGGGSAGVTNFAGVNVTTGESAGGAGGNAANGTPAGGTAVAPGGNGGNGRGSTTTSRPAGGGGGGDGAAGAASPSNGVGGAGGAGTASSITGTSLTYAAGGGGGGRTTGGAGVSGVSGAGGLAIAGTAAPGNRGGGGGGAGNGTSGTKAGGNGGSGVVIISYAKNAGCFSAPQSPSFSNPTFSWTAPATTPTGQTVSSYTVMYKRSTDTTYGNIYARRVAGQTATSLNITGVDNAACATNNSALIWTCVSVQLVSGQTYDFKVFARGSATSSFGRLSTAVQYTVP